MLKFFTSRLFVGIVLVLLIAYFIYRQIARSRRVRQGEENYKPYKALLREAFKSDKSSRDRAMEAIAYLEADNPRAAEKLLGRLMVECHDPEDFTAVRAMLAVCYQRMGEELKAERYYRRILEDAHLKRPVYAACEEINRRNGRMDLLIKAAEGIEFEPEEESLPETN